MQAFARAGDHEAARREMDQVRAEFDNACLAFGDMWRQERVSLAQEPLATLGVITKRTLEEHVDRLERQISSLQTDVLDTVSRVQSVEQPLLGLHRAVEQHQRVVQTLHEHADETRKLAATLVDATGDLTTKLEDLAAASDRRDSAIDDLSAVVEEHRADLSRDLAHLREHSIRQDASLEGLVAESGERYDALDGKLDQLTASACRRDAAIDDVVAKLVAHHADMQRLIDAQAKRITDLEVAADASARHASDQAEIATHIHGHSAKLSRIQYSLDGAIARLDTITARSSPSRFRTTTKRGVERLRKAGRWIERGVRKVRKELGRMVRLQSLRNYLARRWFRRTVRTIRASGLFDTTWYLREYPDVAATGMDPVLHFLKYGVDEGRCPNPLFHTRWYLEQNPDVATAKANPLLHYLHHGAAEGRDPSPLFQTTAWVTQHPELRATKQNPLAHCLSRIDLSLHESAGATNGDPALASLLAFGPTTTPSVLTLTGSSVGEVSHDTFSYSPLISIVVPVYDTPAALLEKMIVSVQRQAYENWELCLVDDASPRAHVRPLLEQAAARDPRIRVTFRASNGNISAATNTGIALARGEFVAFLDHDDELTPEALLEVVRLLNDEPDTDVVYTDQDKIDLDDRPSEPFYKPAWSPAYLESVMYVGHLLVVRASVLADVGGCDGTFDGVQDFELMLRLGEATKKIRHLPKILYHWRMIPGSIASDVSAKNGIVDLQRKAVQAHLDRLGLKAIATTVGTSHRVRVVPAPRSHEPLVSILIPSKDHPELIGPCLASLFEKTTYKTFEVIVGDNETSDPEALRLFDRYPVTRVPLPGKFCFAAFNNRMAEKARGDYLLLLNNDTEVVQPDWLETLMLYAEQEDVGAVGPMLLYGDGTVQHAGVILGPRGTADHVMRGFPGDSDGYAGSLQAAREVTAVTGACLLVRRDHFMACGGLNETFGRHYEDVDFCLRLRRLGLRNIFVGGARMVHHESKSRGSYYDFTDRVLLLDHWESWIQRGDPYYNPSFDPERVDYSVRVA
jgi:GT2 family glycosyltransferase